MNTSVWQELADSKSREHLHKEMKCLACKYEISINCPSNSR